jgi:hypothetical protein
VKGVINREFVKSNMNIKFAIPILILLLLVPVVFAESEVGMAPLPDDIYCESDADCMNNWVCRTSVNRCDYPLGYYYDSKEMLDDYCSREYYELPLICENYEECPSSKKLPFLVIGITIGAVVMGIVVLLITKTDEKK